MSHVQHPAAAAAILRRGRPPFGVHRITGLCAGYEEYIIDRCRLSSTVTYVEYRVCPLQ